MEQLHQLAALPDEDEYVTIADVASHLLMHHTAERTDSLTHVCTSLTFPYFLLNFYFTGSSSIYS